MNTDSSNIDNDSNIIESHIPMISDLLSPSHLIPEYELNPNPGFIQGIKYLSSKYSTMRKVRGDGNCFYRSFLFAYLEGLRKNGETEFTINELKRFREIIVNSKEYLIALGYEEFTFESFYDVLIELLDELFTITLDDLLNKFQENGESNYYTWFMRLLTSLSMKQKPDDYLPFILDAGIDLDEFCRLEVEPMDKECDQVQISALSTLLGIIINIEYLDGKSFDATKGLSLITSGDGGNDDLHLKSLKTIHLLYRPGHYDILYL